MLEGTRELEQVNLLKFAHSLCCILVACCFLVFVGAGLVTMCVFHQTSSHLPPHPTALDHRTSRSTPLISLSPLSLFLHSLIVFEISAPYFNYNAFLSLVHWLLISWLVFLSVQSPQWSLLLHSLIFRSPFPCVSSQCWISHMLSLWLKVYQPDAEPVRIPLLWSEPCSCNLRNLSSALCIFGSSRQMTVFST